MNSVSIGPGAIPVFFSGTVMSMLAISPLRAFIMTLFLPNSTFSLNGDIFVNMNITCPFSSAENSFIPGTSNVSSAFFATLSLTHTNSTSPFKVFLKGKICVERTLAILIIEMVLYFFGNSNNC